MSIPFNLEIEEEKKRKLTKKELIAKQHLEEMVEITKKIGYNDIKLPPRENRERQEKKEIQKEREE